MPTRAEYPKPYHIQNQDVPNWTDDLPVCKKSGVGYSTNIIYRENGFRLEDHPFEDRSFHFCLDDLTSLYGVFDGNKGIKAATFALQGMPAEILLGQLNGKTSDDEVKDVLRQAFISVEKGYMDILNDCLAERTNLQLEIPVDLTPYEAFEKYPHMIHKLKELNSELSSGTTAVVVLIHRNRLYVANVGNSRALLCKTDSEGVLRVIQLTVDHVLTNEDEILRLSQLGLDAKKMREGMKLGNQDNTRCLGNYLVKGGYRDFEELSNCISEPIIADPEIYGGTLLDDKCRFLLLMSDGLYKSLEDANGTNQVNQEIAKLVVEQFREQSTLTGVAQAVVDKVVRIHHDTYMNESGSASSSDTISSGRRDDITLLVRNFNFPLSNKLASSPNPVVRFNPLVTTVPNTSWESGSSSEVDPYSTLTSETQNESSTTESSSDQASVCDRNQKISPYVDFSEFFSNVEQARREGTLPKDIDFT